MTDTVACLCLQPKRSQRPESSKALPGPMPGSYGACTHSAWVLGRGGAALGALPLTEKG